MMQRKRLLTAKVALVAALTASSISGPVQAGIPTLDVTNLVQNILSAMEGVQQTAKMIQQYQTQLQQYENMLQNTMTPPSYIWDQAQSTIRNIVEATNTLDHYKNRLGSLDAYLGKFQDVEYYRNSPCVSGPGECTATERAAMAENRRLASESQKKANDALFKGLDQQQQNLQSDARNLERLQSNAQTAEGQLEAIGYANQLASHQSNQLLQIRGLLIAQQNVVATQMQAELDEKAQQQAGDEQFLGGSYRSSPERTW